MQLQDRHREESRGLARNRTTFTSDGACAAGQMMGSREPLKTALVAPSQEWLASARGVTVMPPRACKRAAPDSLIRCNFALPRYAL